MALVRKLKREDVLNWTGWSKGTLGNRIKAGEFPPPIATGARTRVWLETDVQAYFEARVAERDRVSLASGAE